MQRIFRNANAVHAFTQGAKRSRGLSHKRRFFLTNVSFHVLRPALGTFLSRRLSRTSVGGDLESQTLIDAPELLAERVHLALDSRCGGGRREHARNRRYRSHGMKVSEASTEALACYPFLPPPLRLICSARPAASALLQALRRVRAAFSAGPPGLTAVRHDE